MLELNKNLLINGGNKYYSQRKPSGQLTPTTSYQYLTVDRWNQKITGTITTPTVEAAADFPDTTSPWCSKYTGTTAAGSSISEQQRIEADFGLELIGDYISFLGYVTSTSYQTATVNIGYANTKDNHAAQTQLFTKSWTIAVDGTIQTLAWPKISQLTSLISTGLYVEIVLSSPSNTATSSTHRFGGMNLIRGRYNPTDNIIAARSLVDELRYCQRYLYCIRKDSVAGSTPGLLGITYTTSNAYIDNKFPVQMRIAPIRVYNALSEFSFTDLQAGVTPTELIIMTDYTDKFSFRLRIGASGLTSIRTYTLQINNFLSFDAEL